MQTIVTVIALTLAFAQADPARDALRLGRTGDQANKPPNVASTDAGAFLCTRT